MKELAFWILVVTAIFAVASCGEDALPSADLAEAEVAVSSNDGIFIANKFTYEADAEKSIIRTYSASCRVEGDSLVWNPKGSISAVGIYSYDPASKNISFLFRGGSGKFQFRGSAFPVGSWVDSSSAGISKSFTLSADGSFDESIRMRDSTSAAELAEEFLSEGFRDFKGVNLAVQRIYDGKIFADVSTGDVHCSISVKPRHAAVKKDCEEAFAEYREHSKGLKSPEKFSFEDYALEVGGDTGCLGELLENL